MSKTRGLNKSLAAGAALLALMAAGPGAAAQKAPPSDTDLCGTAYEDQPASGWDAACLRLTASPDNAQASLGHVNLGVRRLYEDDAKALEAAEAALALTPEFPAAMTLRGRALYNLKRFPEARAAYELMLKRKPDDGDALVGLGDVTVAETKDYARAEFYYAAAIAAAPNDPWRYYLRAGVRELRDDAEGALADYTQAARLAPGEGLYQRLRAELLASLGRTDEALKVLAPLLKADPADRGALYSRARVYRIAGDTAASLRDVEAAIAAGEETARARMAQADLLLDMDRYEDAVSVAAAASAKWPQDIDLQLMLAKAQVFARREEALAATTRILAADDANAQAHYLRGLYYSQQGNLPKALIDLDAAVRLAPASVEAVYVRGLVKARGGDRAGAIADYDTATRLAPKDISLYVAKAELLYDPKAPEAALDVLDAGLRIDPTYGEALRKRGWLAGESGDWARGRIDMEAAAKAAPEDPDTLYDVAVYRAYAGDPAGARSLLDRVLRLDPDRLQALKDRGQLLRDAGRDAEALKDYDRAVELARGDAGLLVDRAETRAKLKDEAGALRDYAAALTLDPRSTQALTSRALLYMAKGAYDLAQADQDKAVEIKPEDPKILFGRAVLYIDQGEQDRAIRDLNAVLRLTPGDAYALSAKGDAYRLLGDHLQAIEYYDQAIAARPDDAQTWWRRALSKAEMGDATGAAADRAQARKLNPRIEKLEG